MDTNRLVRRELKVTKRLKRSRRPGADHLSIISAYDLSWQGEPGSETGDELLMSPVCIRFCLGEASAAFTGNRHSSPGQEKKKLASQELMTRRAASIFIAAMRGDAGETHGRGKGNKIRLQLNESNKKKKGLSGAHNLISLRKDEQEHNKRVY